MAQDSEKQDLRVEDRRHFDKDGNPIHREEEAAGPEGEARPHSASERAGSPGPPPRIDFSSLVFLYVQTALVHLGELEEPGKETVAVNVDAARQMIDIIELLRDKTRGNLSSEEEQYVEKMLFDLRMLYIQKTKSTQ
jgi:hypothetical protein